MFAETVMKARNPLRWLGWALVALVLAQAPLQAAEKSPEVLLQDVSEQMIERLKAEREAIRAEPVRLFEVVAEVLEPRVDLELMSRLVLGVHWRRAEPAQRERFEQAFRNLIVRFYTSALLEEPGKLDELLADSEGLIEFRPARIDDDGEKAVVRGAVHLPEGQDVPVMFRMHHRGEEWLVYDVTVEGVSLVTNYRNSFSQEIQHAGLENLIQRLEERNDEILKKARQGSLEGEGAPIPG